MESLVAKWAAYNLPHVSVDRDSTLLVERKEADTVRNLGAHPEEGLELAPSLRGA